jgi:hypothetical protein
MSRDISHILQQWEFEPDDISVRIVAGDDGREKIQMRIELGVLQMEIDGRPDGTRPEDCESWLDFYEEQCRAYEQEHPEGPPYILSEDDCGRLWREGVQYYHRYLSFWHLQRHEECARDTARNLRLFAFVRQHAAQDRIKLHFDQWRPYVTMMHARAKATPLLKAQKWAETLKIVEAGIDGIRDFLDDYQQSHHAEQCPELVNLERWREEILRARTRACADPADALDGLQRKLQAAIADEEFEEAARLRDEIRQFEQHERHSEPDH